ncbi:MAG TPA: 2-hydroxyacyl-CoA dehydratase family protein [Myxococcota bacterium]|nr:2-hydroxyacyl-CoA dehydratase family protein [Myxococcota bacterium]HRY92280.1 2-hydroxyacyl-CoA dehydratase family protein [Myxococcota bacterium]
MSELETGPGAELPVPLPDLPVVEEMQLGIVTRFADVKLQKAQGKPAVYCSVLMPKEILLAMDVATVYSDMLGAYASIMGMSEKYCQAAEEAGLSRDVCAVHRCTVGVANAAQRDDFFEMAFAVPDLVIGSNYPCMSESKSFLQVVDRYKTPYYFLDAPINQWGQDVPQHVIDYYVLQLQGMIDFLVAHGHTFDLDRLKEEVAFTKRLNTLLQEVDLYKRAVPTPLRAYDNVIATTAPIALSKEARTLAIFERYRDELKARVARGFGVVPEEKLRLMWVGMPPLCDFKLLNYPEAHGAVVAKSMLEFLTGFTLDPALMDPDKPLESIARAQLVSPANPLYKSVIDYLVNATRDYRIDGVISVVKRSCGFLPGMQRLTKEAILEATGVPSLVFDMDGVDVREYDPAATKANLDAFIETLLARKKRGA